jgi:hypothetical protein
VKDSRIARDLAGYLRRIVPSTPSEAVMIDGRHGVRVRMTPTITTDMLLHRSFWKAHPAGTLRFPVAETYPLLTSYIAYLVATAASTMASGVALVPLDRNTSERLAAMQEHARLRVDEATRYLHQVLRDPATSPRSLLYVRRGLRILGEHDLELAERARRRAVGPPTPAGSFGTADSEDTASRAPSAG